MGSDTDTDPESQEGPLVEEPLNETPKSNSKTKLEKKQRKVLFITLAVAISVSAIVTGLFVGLTTTTSSKDKEKPNDNGSSGSDAVDQGDPNNNPNDTPISNGDVSADENGNQGDTNSHSGRPENSIGSIQNGLFRTSANQPLQAELEVFSRSSLLRYSSCADLRNDIYNTASIIANEAILAHGDMGGSYYPSYYDGDVSIMMEEIAPAEEMPVETNREDSYETNNQVEGVDEADVVKSTADHVFAAYGDKLIVWEAVTGQKLSVTKIASNEEKDSSSKVDENPFFKMMPVVGSSSHNIKGLLIHDGYLTAIVSRANMFQFQNPVLHGFGETTVLHFDISAVPNDGSELPLLATHNLYGTFEEARLIDGFAHVVTLSQVDSYYHLTRHLHRYQDKYKNMTDVEYTEAATTYATGTLLPSFADRLLDELETHMNCEDVIKMSLFETVSDEAVNITVPRVDSLMNGLLHIATYDMHVVDRNVKALDISSTVDFVPSAHGSTIYSTKTELMLAVRGYRHTVAANGSWRQHTYIKSYSLNNDGDNLVEGHSIGIVHGHLINQYSMDVFDGHLRVASTIDSQWGCVHEEEDGTGICSWKMLTDSDNYISVLELPTDGQVGNMKHVGILNDLGEAGERIEAVRFMKEKAFLVTFLRTDPFYTIDLRDHTAPKVIGELKVSGYSNYLHPYDAEGNLLIAVGQEADDNGVSLGLQISLFDTTDFENPTLLKRYNVEDDPNVWSSSEAQYDPKAFRFLPQSKKLILPASVRSPRNPNGTFDGFLIFDIAPESILLSFKISHAEHDEMMNYCWYGAYMPGRSLVHNGIVTTIKGHTVLSHDLDSKTKQWELNLDEGNKVCNDYWKSPHYMN